MAESGDNTQTIDLSATFAAKVGNPNAYELLSQSLAAVSDEDNLAAIQLSGSQRVVQEAKQTETQKRRRDAQIRETLDIIDQARRFSERLSKQIAAMEASFRAQHGDAWREVIANRVMDPDTIPQRRRGESMAAYRERLEVALIATMIDPVTGKAKPEFANSDDPDIRRYAKWAEAQHQKNEVDAYIERRNAPGLSEAEREAEDRSFAASRTGSGAMLAEDQADASGIDSRELRSTIDNRRDEQAANASAEAAAFGLGSNS